eukprot:Clim_evm98s134 gene=Clim_evmTU98s134
MAPNSRAPLEARDFWRSMDPPSDIPGLRLRFVRIPKTDEEYQRRKAKGEADCVIPYTGATIRVAECGDPRDPLLLFVHGWPEGWFSWRHQLNHYARTGRYHCVAVDVRGFGMSEPWTGDDHDYDLDHVRLDLLGVVRALGHRRACYVGHDFGALLGWWVCLRHSDVFPAMIMISIPHVGHEKVNPKDRYEKVWGENFFYINYHNEDGGKTAAAEYQSDTRHFLINYVNEMPIYGSKDGISPKITDTRRSAGGILDRYPRLTKLPDWITAQEFDYMVKEHEMAGWRACTGLYRNFERNWYQTAELKGQKLTQECLFVCGDNDPALALFPSKEAIRKILTREVPKVQIEFVPATGHLVYQEAHTTVNGMMDAYLKRNWPGGNTSRL